MIPDWATQARAKWQYVGRERPSFAEAPGEGQESVWDYPRPPRLAPDAREIVVRAGDIVIARSTRAVRALETASPPTFYLPPDDVDRARMEPSHGSSRCEWKGEASYWTVVIPSRRIERVAWSYLDPLPGFEMLRDYLSFYPSRLECYVNGEGARQQPGVFYGGWVTSEIVGPFKGAPGTEAW
jgi:uncharacterized protein (DUF427 family)